MDYIQALENAIIYIENHLGEDITVEDVARAAGYSYYHLTRQFSAILGENVGSYIKRRRLADGAKKLLYTNERIIDIAMENGFASSEAFSRAFKAVYQVSPSLYRKNRLDLFISAKERLEPKLLRHRVQNITVHPKIVELPDIQVAGLRGQTTLRDNILPQLWTQFNALVDAIPNRKAGGRGFGICEACNEGNSIYSMSDNVLFSEVVAVEVNGFSGLSEAFVAKTLQAGRYAVFTHKGSLALLKETFDYIWGTWFLNTQEKVDCREDFELYDERFLGYGHPDSQIELYIPIC
ncbi:AraC family transcriptional regulator [Sporomusa acidovorans]|uniref:Right origin-binding protein n=1 Tax=Sporomusa acidovorans (strain ATCC 49682 / DSM 3132 / Mol) TaxID=1123286 RepID=A0ABZ3J716_SPOA4|nr:AraC family transcriptional regulator [Sporomusa acidovorans]OZC24316.1 right origin-binding protein [Sporomusa acidovorans DSM 3132]SDF02220.1 transcriptional regulator, AraC family [Sporomusa acidovorans]